MLDVENYSDLWIVSLLAIRCNKQINRNCNVKSYRGSQCNKRK